MQDSKKKILKIKKDLLNNEAIQLLKEIANQNIELKSIG